MAPEEIKGWQADDYRYDEEKASKNPDIKTYYIKAPTQEEHDAFLLKCMLKAGVIGNRD